MTSWYPIFLSYGGKFFDNDWKVTFNSPQGKAAADFFVGKLKSLAPQGVAEYDSDQEGAAILGGEAARSSSTPATRSSPTTRSSPRRSASSTSPSVPKQAKAIAQIGIFIHGVSTSAPNKDNAITFMKWFAHRRRRRRRSRARATCPCARSRSRTRRSIKAHRLLPTVLAQLNAGAEARPRTPDWRPVERILGTELNKALVAGKGGGDALDRAAKQATAYLKRQGYYS